MRTSAITSPIPGNADRTDSWPKQIELLGMPMHPITFDEAVNHLMKLAHGDRPSYAVTANVDHVVRTSRCPELRYLYDRADLVLADGMPLVWASRILGHPLPERVTGSDLFPALCARAAEEGLSVFLLGGARSTDENAEAQPLRCGERYCRRPCAARKAAEVLQARHPRLRIAGTYCPDYGFENDPVRASRVVEAVRSTRPDILFVGLGSPKQEIWIVANLTTCGAKLSMGLGISFGFVAGDVPRAPHWMQRAGLEWFHRLCKEPRRLWRRYLVDDTKVISLIMSDLLKRHRVA